LILCTPETKSILAFVSLLYNCRETCLTTQGQCYLNSEIVYDLLISDLRDSLDTWCSPVCCAIVNSMLNSYQLALPEGDFSLNLMTSMRLNHLFGQANGQFRCKKHPKMHLKKHNWNVFCLNEVPQMTSFALTSSISVCILPISSGRLTNLLLLRTKAWRGRSHKDVGR